ncbi:leader peptidase (prepilin peptidase) / N-methyltransferase [Paractinoplanes atraurantiacus]|uniref:Leader peptidase (Prepilin peptidase) / N-methyltransferase n=1 Tax=Paractinoplanes atraurantiacus TaxID=1036182 RepID=A0A285JFF5_9ACTN|nr:leader peptidase (prepilin peptidase) / N-methyltransferase [Actinoplanes atraurantiacus]
MILAATFGAATAFFLPRIAYRLAVPGGSPLSLRGYVVTTATGAAIAATLAVAIGESPLLPVYLLAAVPGLLLAMIDLRCLRLPDRIVGLLALVAGVPLAVMLPSRIGPALLAGVLVSGAYLLVPGFGLGDVKLAGVLAFILGFAGWPAVAVGVIVPHLIGGPIAVFLLVTGRSRIFPFGPALLAGALAAVSLTAA